ncbi:MAG TPA: ATP-binding protein [Bryobacteraceae bacterium]|nr:ATP-binding protein [Bryobacteraceae bacterium]
MIRGHSSSTDKPGPKSLPVTQIIEPITEIESSFRELFELAPVAYHEIDASGILRRVNQAECRMLRFAPEEMIGKPVWEFVSTDQQRECREAIYRKVSCEELIEPYEHDFIRRDGGYLILELYDSLIRDRSGEVTGIRSVLLDVTDRRLAEQLLANEVAERERLTVALRRSKEEAEKANRAKSEFLSRMSHELRTPLNAILGFAQLLDMAQLDRDKRESVGQILKAGQHLLGLINEVLEISRIEAGRLSFSPEPVLISSAVQETLDLLTPMAIRRKISLRDELAHVRKRHVLADQQRLKQVLLNVISNAIKYNCDSGTVTISAKEFENHRLRVMVRDTGPGIKLDDREKLFTPFERLGAEQTGVEGTGLGLALSKRLLEMMGGSIDVENNPDRGCTFSLDLPLVQDPLEQAETAIEELPAPPDTTPHARERIVLYVEDNLSNITLIEHIMVHRPNVRLVPAMQGRLGLDLAREHRPDLILLDLHLPDISGEDVLIGLRQEPELKDIPVIVISADATHGRIERLIGMGVLDYLPKPLDIKRFLELLDTCLTEKDGSPS